MNLIKQYDKLAVRHQALTQELGETDKALAELRLALLQTVTMTQSRDPKTGRRGKTTTLTHGGRVLKAVYNDRRRRYSVKEGNTTLVPEYMGNIHDLRFDIACGGI